MMIKSFFFIPASHPRLATKLLEIDSDYLIIDLEDAVAAEDVDKAFQVLSKVGPIGNYFVRLRLISGEVIDHDLLDKALKLGFRKFLIPKFETIQQIEQIKNMLLNISDIEIILLIENAKALNNAPTIISRSQLNIIGIGFGSQDYCNATGMEHSYEILKFPRFLISNMAKAYNIMAIDIACMAIKDDSIFLYELEQSKAMGFNGKFVIHPNQLRSLKAYSFYSEGEIQKARDVISKYESLGKPALFIYSDILVEPPHIKEYIKILEWDANAKR